MPITDPTFQHSDEDWTQITQPRLRKRVQNRVSQRKHRSKIRQQRANSVDAERAMSATKGTREHSLHSGSISSNSSSNPGGQQQGQHEHELSKQVFAEPDHLHPWSGTHGLAYSAFEDPPYAEAHQPWLDYPSSSYPVPSAYPVESPSIPITHTPVSNSYALTQSTGAIGRSYPYSSSTAPSMANTGMGAMRVAHHEPQQHSYYTSPTSVSSSQYLTTTDSTGFPPQERLTNGLRLHSRAVIQPRILWLPVDVQGKHCVKNRNYPSSRVEFQILFWLRPRLTQSNALP
ncbi:MAG: hypothetical protein L6R38_009330, partial [Xanthoria sp. 2 TBL-2021]